MNPAEGPFALSKMGGPGAPDVVVFDDFDMDEWLDSSGRGWPARGAEGLTVAR